MWYETDDFFYYAKSAANFAHGLGSTFGGFPTNGYHPLWFLLIAAASRLSSAGSDLSIRIFLAASIFIATMVTYFLAEKLLPLGKTNPAMNRALAAIVALYGMHLYCLGMEVTLAIPLILAVALVLQGDRLWDGGLWPAAGFGLLLAAMVLSRLDTGLIVILLAAGVLLSPALRSRLSFPLVGGIILGFIPVFLYLASNKVFFHTVMPVSGMAKQLKSGLFPSGQAWYSFLHYGFQGIFLIPILIAILLLPLIYRRLTETQRVVYPILLIYPFFYVFLLSCLSDWILWPWYFYGLRPALCISFASLLLWQPAGRLIMSRAATAVAAVAVLGLTFYWIPRHPPAEGIPMQTHAAVITQFAATHPGVYAMGDRAGMVGYLTNVPLIQTEGLMMDRDYLRLIQAKTPLREALAKYNVRYYVSSVEKLKRGPCFHAVEPWQAGPKSPHMTADLCEPPVLTFTKDDITIQIFDLQPDAK